MKLSEAKKIFNDTVTSQLAKCTYHEEQTDWLKKKNLHSKEVLEAGIEIINAEKSLNTLDEEIIETAKSVLLLHDLGRFHQFKPNGDLDTKIEHGKLGAKILLKKYKVENDPYLILPIKYHDKIDLSQLYTDKDYLKLDTKKQKITELLCKLVRDADRIANIRKMICRGFLSFNKRQLTINPKILKIFYKKQLVDLKLRESVFDSAVANLCWQFDLNFKISKDIYKKEKLNKLYIDKIQSVTKKIRQELIEQGGNKKEVEQQEETILKQIDEIKKFLNKENK